MIKVPVSIKDPQLQKTNNKGETVHPANLRALAHITLNIHNGIPSYTGLHQFLMPFQLIVLD